MGMIGESVRVHIVVVLAGLVVGGLLGQAYMMIDWDQMLNGGGNQPDKPDSAITGTGSNGGEGSDGRGQVGDSPTLASDDAPPVREVSEPTPSTFFSTVPSTDLRSNLVGYWPLNGTMSKWGSVGASADFSTIGEDWAWVKSGGSPVGIRFGSNSRGTAAVDLPTENLTVSLWLKPPTSGFKAKTVLTYPVSPFAAGFALTAAPSGLPLYQMKFGRKIGAVPVAQGEVKMVPDRWHHVVGQIYNRDGTAGLRLYLDGKRVDGSVYTGVDAWTGGAGTLMIGGRGFNGGISHLRVYRGIIQQDRIQDIAESPPGNR